MSLWSNNSSFSNNRSIFETFNAAGFGDEDNNVVSDFGINSLSTDQPQDMERNIDDGGIIYFTDSPVEEEENVATLFMSCSPGRDFSEDDDDSVPLSQLQISKQQSSAGSRKKSSASQKQKKRTRKDPNAPKRPLSAYKLFFRDTLASIKAQNPDATFGDVSRIVSSMWDSLEPHEKEKYSEQVEKNRKEYAEALAAYEAQKKSGLIPTKRSISKKHSKTKSAATVESSDSDLDAPDSNKSSSKSKCKSPSSSVDSDLDSDVSNTDSEISSSSSNQVAQQCSRSGCRNTAVDDPRWDFDFCSANCVVVHCRDVFTAWVASRRSTKV